MKKILTDVFHNEQEYYQQLLYCIRKMLADYIEKYVHASDSGILRRSGGVIVYHDELMALAQEVNETLQNEGEDTRLNFKEALRSIRECGKRTLRSGRMITMEYLFHVLNLNEFEAFLVILAYSCELDHELEMLIACLGENNSVRMPTISLGVRLYTGVEKERRKLQQQCMSRWEILSLLFESMDGISSGAIIEQDGFFERGLKLDYRIASYLQDFESIDEALSGVIQYKYKDVDQDLLIHKKIADGMDRLYNIDSMGTTFFLHGEHGCGKKMQAAKFCERQNMPLLLVEARRLPLDLTELRRVLKRIVREAILQGNAAICIFDLEKDIESEKINRVQVENILWGLNFWNGLLILTSRYEWDRTIQENEKNIRKISIPETKTEERIILWKEWLQPEEIPADINLEFLADKYTLSPGCIKSCIMEYRDMMYVEEDAPRISKLLEACRNQIDHRLGKDAIRIRAQYKWDDLVLPSPQKTMLKDVCNQVFFHHQVYHRWGFEEKVAYGKGVSMIFYGPPGTGKTMGAQVIANELKLELYKVDMAGVMSKYVGESEKKLGNIFEQAKKSQSILFFDEADVLFGKRTEQKDSNDKYSNASTAYLLQKIEEYEGIIILATNLLQNFDNAFLRRFKFIIEFPFTDVTRRKEIWQKVFPDNVPKEELDIEYLAEKFNFSGSQIKNVAVAAAFLAAGEETVLNMQHVLIAIKREMAKTGKKLIASDFGPYYYLMEEQEG